MFAQSSSQGSPEADIEKLKSLLKDGGVAKVKVLHLPDSTLTRVAVSQEALRSIAGPIQGFSGHIPEKFNPLLSGVSVRKETQTPDLRWGVFFYDTQDHEIGSVFVDKFGRYGYLNDETVSFETGSFARNLAKRLHRITGIRD
jgi:hypothetical protein